MMAKIESENIVITVSRLIKDSDTEPGLKMVTPDVIAALEQVAQELIGNGAVVEINLA
jgi:hypothetical protein